VKVFGLPPLPASLKTKRARKIYLGSNPAADHLRTSIDAKMGFVQEILDELFHFVAVRSAASLTHLAPPPLF
jgi:hypothetical protein